MANAKVPERVVCLACGGLRARDTARRERQATLRAGYARLTDEWKALFCFVSKSDEPNWGLL